jgi:glycine betaine/proline transport system ATP-binding protein
LMDEAFSALDPLIRMDMQAILLDLQAESRKTVVFITHDLDEALRLGEKIAILRDGEVIQQGTGQEIVLNPTDEYISSFVQEVNRGRVILVETIMRPLASPANAKGPPVSENSNLEDTARLMSDAGTNVAHVVDSDGKPSGSLAVQDVMSALVTPCRHDDAA